ncbi:uncharacterized protein LOC122505321 isoform X2 [Leptopilina heterotoma]|uniref:uncharacterized protein LOC122505321 isoform X2 n=1 Tax=Leptopilina heterotoma TaxID=63436 RepID=UPI001CA93DBA|nr:uncharacterized protein LOC122505321 isoform X2 [Leptopilina heterotoma]
MTSNEFDSEFFERKLLALKDSQDSIQSLSAWCLERRQHHKKIVATWLQVLKKVKVEHRLTLFYLANDVIQYSKRKNFEFVESWGTTLQRATTMVRDEKVKHRILRIFKIWDQRQVYDEEFLTDLSGLIQAAPKKKAEPQPVVPEEFQAALLISTMRSCSTLEQATDARLRDLRESNVDIDNAEELCASLKDRRHVEDAEKEVEVAVRNVENYVRALEAEIRERTQVLELLEQADQFYETQRGEVKIVTNAYRNFGSRVKHLKKKLDELLPMLTSPIPSPDINAPSPSPDSDIDLPGEELQLSSQKSAIIEIAPPIMYGSYNPDYEPSTAGLLNQTGDFTPNFSSFMDGNMDFDMRNVFSESSMTPNTNQIEVINSSGREKNEDFSISSFLKTVLPTAEGPMDAGDIPGLGDALDSSQGDISHGDYNISHIPGTPINKRLTNNLSNVNNHHMLHSTPIAMRTLSGESHTSSPYSSQNSQNNILTFDGNLNSANPLPPPPLPPPIFLDDENCYNKLPSKFPTWTSNEVSKEPPNWDEKVKNSMNPTWQDGEEGDEEKEKNAWGDTNNRGWNLHSDNIWASNARDNDILLETPESPPIYEKAGFRDPVEYNDSQPQEPLLSSVGDVDHRVIPLPMLGTQLPYRLMKGDVDHRNLISLTGSPANQSTTNDSSPVSHSHNTLWSSTDQDYRQVQAGDNVESVDMELSDDENEVKQKGRGVLVDVRTQDRNMRPPPPVPETSHHMDMDMRMIPLPGGCGPQDVHNIHQAPPPPPPPLPSQQFHHRSADFQQNNPIEFRQNEGNFQSEGHPPFNAIREDFPSNLQNFPSNRENFTSLQQNFGPNTQNFPPNVQNFSQNLLNFHQDFHTGHDFDYRDNQHERWNKDESNSHGRFSQYDQQRDNLHRSDRVDRGGGGRGRGNRGNRRDKFPDDHSKKNSRRQRSHDHVQISSPVVLQNNNPVLIETTNGETKTGQKEFTENQEARKQDFSLPNNRLSEENQQSANSGNINSNVKNSNQSTGSKNSSLIAADSKTPEHKGNVKESEKNKSAGNSETPKQLSEQLEALMKSSKNSPQPSKRSSINLADSHKSVESTSKNFVQVINGPLLSTPNGPPLGPSIPQASPVPPSLTCPLGPPCIPGIPELHPVVVFDYETPNASPMFRPRMRGVPPTSPFAPWRGGMPPHRGRPGFRGGPRLPWPNNSPRGPTANSFSPRKRGSSTQFRGGTFRGRGRGSW